MKFRFVVLVLIVLLTGCGGEETSLSELFPGRVGGMELTELVTGTEAMRAVDQLHGKAIEVQDAARAVYAIAGAQPGQDAAVVWVSRQANQAEAREQSAIMLEKMLHPVGGAETPFHDPDQFHSGGADIYRFLGMGLTHLVFYKDDLIYWISAPGQLSDNGVESPADQLLAVLLPE